ncbi:MAG: monovalent cation/H(+) antiporter subunit G [Brevundimonas sp.]|uniref:monovalent cation/H(+) antiporter subunit G n=1 Tax=Brevundimonas sp. TaxID=1871086 RepID=UPI0025B84C81|nr:monovalent cation/H(+) antiporter subunit G [Brevundimonas sp.]MBX3478501.1 monovalent cation/H(+) antiporter subunit G [Brevundimonas sp.]
MSQAVLPLGVAVAVSAALLGGASFALVGAVGASRLRTFYQRVHAPTLGASMGTFLILSGSILYFSTTRQQPVFHEILIAIFLSLTTPISLMLIVRAALARDRLEGSADVPHLAPEADRAPD